jgi:hypothetical protein
MPIERVSLELLRPVRMVQSISAVSLEGHSTISIMKTLEDALDALPIDAINAIVSDSASSCRNAREAITMKPKYMHIIQHRCLAHLLNRMGWHFTKSEAVDRSLKWAAKITGFVASNVKLQALIRQSGANQVKRATPTRWYSTITMIDTLIGARDVIVEATSSIQDCRLATMIVEESSWSQLQHLTKIFYPLAECIGTAERDTGTMGETVKAILEFGRSLFAQDWNDDIIRAAAESFLLYFSVKKIGKEEFELLLASYLLDRRYKIDYLTTESIEMALSAILRIGVKCNLDLKRAKKALIPEFELYCSFESDYATDAANQGALEWWRRRSDSGRLQQVALRIARLRSSSANIERTFSALKYVQGSWRMNLSLETLRDLARLRLIDDEGIEDLVSGFEGLAVNEPDDSREILPDDEAASQSAAEVELSSNLEEKCDLLVNPASKQSLRSFSMLIDYSKITVIKPAVPEETAADSGASIDDILKEYRARKETRNSHSESQTIAQTNQ